MKRIIVAQPKNESLLANLECLYKCFREANGEKVHFDLSGVKWKSPLLLSAIAAYIHSTGSTYESGVDSYLDYVRFPKGVSSIRAFEEARQRSKTYIPISVLKKENGSGRERLESLFIDMVKSILAAQHPGVHDAISYPITEIVTNVLEHSGAEKGLIFAQYYQTKKYLDICIVDTGRGLSASYKEEKGLEFSDEEAIEEAMNGHSTKKDKERGYGLRTSKNIVCKALGGEFVFVSGSAVLVSDSKRERLAPLPGFNWQGVIVAYRIPKPSSPIDIYQFVE